MVELTLFLHLVPRLRTHGAIPNFYVHLYSVVLKAQGHINFTVEILGIGTDVRTWDL